MYKLSIIIPHFNAPVYLRRLLDSIPKSTDIEIIVVDDKSNKFVDEYLKLMNSAGYSHVKFLSNNTKKKGAGVCRNIGLKNATGKWVLFADADDYFLDGFYNIVCKYFDTNYDVIFFAPTSIYADTGLPANRHAVYEKIIKNYLEGKKDSELYLRYYFRTPCSKMIRRSFLVENKIEFDEVIICNDNFFSVKVGHYMKNFAATLEKIYCITDSSQSLTKKRGGLYFYTCAEVMIRIDRFLKQHLKKSDYKKVRVYGTDIIHFALRNSPQSIFEAIKISIDNKLPLMPLRYLNPVHVAGKIIGKLRKILKMKKGT